MTKSVATAKALKRRPQGLVALAVAGVATIVLAACGPAASGGSSHQQSPAPTHATAPAHSANPIPQGNGGDGDADNNGGPSDGDGNI